MVNSKKDSLVIFLSERMNLRFRALKKLKWLVFWEVGAEHKRQTRALTLWGTLTCWVTSDHLPSLHQHPGQETSGAAYHQPEPALKVSWILWEADVSLSVLEEMFSIK